MEEAGEGFRERLNFQISLKTFLQIFLLSLLGCSLVVLFSLTKNKIEII